MLNYFNFKKFGDKYLIVNDVGRFAFLDKRELFELVDGVLETTNPALFQHLQADGFVYRGSDLGFVNSTFPKMRDAKNYLFSATGLHIFVVSTLCNLNCAYCQASAVAKSGALMSEETAERAVDVALQAPNKRLSFEFQGGEPLLNFPVVERIVQYAEARKGDREILYSLVSNGTLFTEEIVAFLKDYNVTVSTSLDGGRALHDLNRPRRCGAGSFDDVCRGIEILRDAGVSVGALLTATRASLDCPEEIVETYCRLGFSNVFLRSLTPLGRARERWMTIGYEPEDYVKFYRRAFDYILTKNQNGVCVQENGAALFLAKILRSYPANYMEFRSPCGAACGQLAYCVDGDVFTCDEGRMLREMGDASFRLGNVFENTYREMIESPVCRATSIASVLEAAPRCCDYPYQTYCGICPVVNLALYNDLYPRSSRDYRCVVYRGMLDKIFTTLKNADETTLEILKGWRV